MGKRVIFIFAVLLSACSGKATESPAGNPLAANPEYQDQPAPAKTNAGATAETDPAPGRPAAKQDREASHSPRHDSASRVKKSMPVGCTSGCISVPGRKTEREIELENWEKRQPPLLSTLPPATFTGHSRTFGGRTYSGSRIHRSSSPRTRIYQTGGCGYSCGSRRIVIRTRNGCCR